MQKILSLILVVLSSTVYTADLHASNAVNIKEKQAIQGNAATSEKNRASTIVSISTPQYVPPFRGAPRNRMGGGTRSTNTFEIIAISPGHTGLTIMSQPTFYFLHTSTKDTLLEFTVVARDAEEPLIETQLTSNGNKLQSIALSQFELKLDPNIEYLWYITIVVNPKLRAKDIVSGGSIRYTAPSASLKAALSQTEPNNKAHLLAQHGIWYDAIMATQQSPITEHQLSPLLQQLGLKLSPDTATSTEPKKQ